MSHLVSATKRRTSKRAATVQAQGEFRCPSCHRNVKTHISTRIVCCSRCGKRMKRVAEPH